MTSLTWASARTWWVPLKISQLMGYKSLLCHTMLYGMPWDDQATALQLCLFSRKGGSAAPHGETPYPCGPRLKWLEMGDELVKAEVEKTIHPVLYMPVSLAVNIHVVVNLSQPGILPRWNQNQVHKTISVSYSVVLYYIYIYANVSGQILKPICAKQKQNIGV